MAKLFMSYASVDRVMVESLTEHLREHHHDVWMDSDRILPGTAWETEITKALDQAEVCLVIVTQPALQSEWVKKEIKIAQQLSKRVMPLVMYEVPLPGALEKLDVAHVQAIDFARFGYEQSFKRLLSTLLSPVVVTERKFRALIIEDIPAQQQAIKNVFKVLDIDTLVASDFDTAFEMVRREKFDIVTLDLQLEEMDAGGQQGVLLLDQLSTHNRDAKVIVVSALNLTGSQVRDFLRKYMAYDYLKKPFDPGDLRRMIESALVNE